MKVNNLKDFGSIRLIAYLTPDTFLKKIMIISTKIRMSDGVGQTAIKQKEALNYDCLGDIDNDDISWKILKQHKSIQASINYHIKLVESKKWTQCESIRKCPKGKEEK